MATNGVNAVDEYIASQPAGAQVALKSVRRALQKALPAAAEVISYKIPAYKVSSGMVLYFAGWKEHYSLYPASQGVVEKFKQELAPYKVSKGTIRFPLSQPVPVGLIQRIAKFRENETIARADAKAKLTRACESA